MKTLTAIALVAALATPAGADDKGNYPANHSCQRVLQNYNTRSRVWTEELAWIFGYADGFRASTNIDPFKYGDPAVGVAVFCQQAPHGTLRDAMNAYTRYATEMAGSQ